MRWDVNEKEGMMRFVRQCALAIAVVGLTGAASAMGQAAAGQERVAAVEEESSSLPDAPQPVAADAAEGRDGQVRERMAGELDKFVEAGEVAPRLTVGDKILMGMRSSVSPYAVIGWVSSATYSEAINGSPYYGQDGKDYLQRLGAASARATSEDIFKVAVLAPALHEDPRYYQMGPGNNFFKRATYSVSRVLVTKTDAGNETLNFALLAGDLSGAALTQAYYPPKSRGFGEVMWTYATSLIGQAVGNLFDEFILSSAEFLQLKRKI